MSDSSAQKPDLPTFTLTSHGILAHIPVATLDDHLIAAQLQCFVYNVPLLLILRRPPHTYWQEAGWPKAYARLGIASFRPEVANQFVWRWEDIYICPRPSHRALTANDPRAVVARLNVNPATPYRIKPTSISALSSHGFRLIRTTNTMDPSTATVRVLLTFNIMHSSTILCLAIGHCKHGEAAVTVTNSSTSITYSDEILDNDHFACLRGYRVVEDCPEPGSAISDAFHTCPDDHVSQWLGNTKTFELVSSKFDGLVVYRDTISLTFAISPLNHSGETLEFELLHQESNAQYPTGGVAY